MFEEMIRAHLSGVYDGPEKSRLFPFPCEGGGGVTHRVRLASESVEGTSLSLQGVDDIHCGDGLPLGVFAVGDSITDDILQEDLQHSPGLFVDQPRDTLDATSASQTSDSGLGDTLDVIPQNLAMTLGASLSQSLSSFTTARHDDRLYASSTVTTMAKIFAF